MPEDEKKYKLEYTEAEIVQEVQSLENDEDVQLFLKTQRGAMKYSKYLEMLAILEKIQKPDK